MMRQALELKDGWQIHGDPHERGRKDGWFASPPADGWVNVALPGTMQGQLGLNAPPVCWYRRVLSAEELKGHTGKRVWLRFESVATDTSVWVNGREVDHHVGDWVPFQVDITDHLRNGDNEIMIRVDRMAFGKEVWIDGAPVMGGHLTKGFHDVLSMHKGGIWQPVWLETTGDLVLVPDGLGITADSRTGRVHVDVELSRNVGGGWAEITVQDADGRVVAEERFECKDGAEWACVQLVVKSHTLWDPSHPSLYTLQALLRGHDGKASQQQTLRFGFRRAEVGGKDGRQILLNGRPIFLSGVLDWGHEPKHISPTPSPEELRERFKTLRAMGFNLVCICMWYPPRYFYEIADEMGMLLWQEHPVWKPPMGDEQIPEYQRQFTKFFRRDRNHASVVMVSGSCEHERFNPKLANFWWGRMRALMPDRIAQIQTAFFAWTDQTKTDAYDEHTYDSCGRWTRYLEDLQDDLDKLPPRPFVMGESILYTNWPDTATLLAQKEDKLEGGAAGNPNGRPWWLPLGLDAAANFEKQVIERFGAPVLERFKRQARRYHLQGRKFQFELYRQYPNHAGLVMNHLRDVPACRCGFQDELERWYFSPQELRPWLGAAPLVLRTPEHLRGFVGGGGASVPVEIGVSNFSSERVDSPVDVQAEGAEATTSGKLSASPGEVAWASASLKLPPSDMPRRVTLAARTNGAEPNSWTLWNLPAPAKPPAHMVRLGRGAGAPFDDADRQLEFEDKAYSSGWGSPVRSWAPLLPDPAELAPELPAWNGPGAVPSGTKCVLAHRLTGPVLDFLVSGGRVVHLVSRARGSAPVKYVNLWGQLPLVVEHGPLGSGDADWVADLLDHDLSKRSVRAVPVGELGLDQALDPIIRLVYCHDIVDRPRLMDFVSMARVGKGLLILSGVDHSTPAGRYMLDRLLAFAVDPRATCKGELSEATVRSWGIP